MSPDLILYNGNFYTQWGDCPRAQAVAIVGGRIVAVGNDNELRPLAGAETRQIDLAGRFAMPALCDAHIHFFDWAISQQAVQLHGIPSFDGMADLIRERVAVTPEGEWVWGRGWVETEWAPAEMPTRHDLDRLSTEHPMIFWRTDMHSAVANTLALQSAEITRQTADPDGGVIGREADGEPNGQLFELAINLVRTRTPHADDGKTIDALRHGMRLLHRMGITAIHDQRMKCHEEGVQAHAAYQQLDRSGELRLRISANVDAMRRHHMFETGMTSGFGSDRLRLGHLKLFVDGSLGSQTAWMLEPFEGTTDNLGVVVTPVAECEAVVREAQQQGWAVSVHAIGDRANREMLDIFEELASERPATLPFPHRIEHVQTIHPDDLPRLAKLGIVASVQPIHATDDYIAAERLWGDRAQNCYRFRSLLDSGATLALGSDAPVADPNPFVGIYAAITRQRPNGNPAGGWFPAERLTLEEAIYGYTVGAATAVGWQHELGRLAPGYHADIIVLDRDLTAISPEAIVETTVERLFFAGKEQGL